MNINKQQNRGESPIGINVKWNVPVIEEGKEVNKLTEMPAIIGYIADAINELRAKVRLTALELVELLAKYIDMSKKLPSFGNAKLASPWDEMQGKTAKQLLDSILFVPALEERDIEKIKKLVKGGADEWNRSNTF